VVNDSGSNNSITVGNGNDTLCLGKNDTVTVGIGEDSFVFQQTTPGSIGAVTVTGFGPNNDSFTFSNQLTTSVSYHDNAEGNAVVTIDNAGDTITLVGVHSADLHPSDFHFVDPPAVPAIATTAQMVADLHVHTILWCRETFCANFLGDFGSPSRGRATFQSLNPRQARWIRRDDVTSKCTGS
jgi:hypothetical protein